MIKKQKIIIIGAGTAGKELLKEIIKYKYKEFAVIGFLDDDKRKIGTTINKVPVLDNIDQLENIVHKGKIKRIFIALPSIKSTVINNIFRRCIMIGVNCQIVPRIREIIEGKVDLKRVRNVEIEDLLGRSVRKPDLKSIFSLIKGQTVLVTGAAGSIGSELCRQIASFKPKKIVMFDWWENGLYQMGIEFRETYPTIECLLVIGNIQDKKRVETIFSQYKPSLIFHAAAFKHVPLMEQHPSEAIKNNILGTKIVADASRKYRIKKFIFVSTDKAADPKNIMGITKSISESLISSYNRETKTKFIAVRFGNVLDSNGSVLPLFRKQISNGGPITITDVRMTRYFMTIPEAAQLILKAATIGKGKEIFILDMGKPIKIIDLAKNLILLSGFIPNKDIKIEIVGKRPGEKIHEKLISNKEKLIKTEFKEIMMVENKQTNKVKLNSFIKKLLEAALSGDQNKTLNLLKQFPKNKLI